jgi:hypothetical protein
VKNVFKKSCRENPEENFPGFEFLTETLLKLLSIKTTCMLIDRKLNLECTAYIFREEVLLSYPDDKGSTFLCNISKHLRDYMVLLPRRQ